jgi:LPS sulfotransferase NodH
MKHGVQEIEENGMNFEGILANIEAPPPTLKKFILLCTEERTGSQLLCQHMATTGVLGRPYEYFHTDGMRSLYKFYPRDIPGQYRAARHLSTTDNGVFALKMHGETLERVAPHVRLFEVPEVYFVYLTRNDVLGQAISLVRARQTNVWHKRAGEKLQSWLHLPKADKYDGELILSVLKDMCFRRVRWETYFARNGIDPLRVSYEAVASTPQRVIDEIATFAGISEEALVDKHEFFERYTRVADNVNSAWRERFVSDYSNLYSFE